jgi:glycosyltransferase involved in cell wall biosynthesis
MNASKLRIGVIGTYGIPALHGGIERHIEEIYVRLAARGHEVTVYCRSHYTEHEGFYKGVHLRRLPAVQTKHLENPTHTLLSSLDALLRRYDLVHYHAALPGLFSFIPRLTGIKTVVTLHGLDWQREKWGRIARWVIKMGEKGAIAFPHATIVVSQTLKAYCKQVYGREVTYIPNGVNIPTPRPAIAIRQFGLESDKYILFVGRLVPEKGCHYLVEAFRGLQTDLKLVLVGGSRHTDAYVQSLQDAGQSNVILPGYVYGEMLEELYSNAYLYVQPSTVEGLPISVLEAMSHGKCALVSDIAENREAIGNCGLVFRSRDVADLRATLMMLLDAPLLVRQMGEEAQNRVSKLYNWDRIAADTESLFLKVMNGEGGTVADEFNSR